MQINECVCIISSNAEKFYTANPNFKTPFAMLFPFPSLPLPSRSHFDSPACQSQNHHPGKTGAPLCLRQKFALWIQPVPSNHPHRSSSGCESSQDISFRGSSPQIMTCPNSSRSPPMVPKSAQKLRATSVVTVKRRSRKVGEAIMSMP